MACWKEREKRKRLARRPGRCNLICAIFTGIFVAEPRGLFSGVFKFKTSLVAYPGTRTLFGDRTRRGLHAIHSFISALRGRWQFLARFFTTWPVCRFFFISFFPPIFFPPVVSLSRGERTESTRKGRASYRPSFLPPFLPTTSRNIHFASPIILQLSRIDLSAAATLRWAFRRILGRQRKHRANASSVHFYFGVSHITPSCYEISRRNYNTVYRIDFSRSKKSCGDEVIQVKIYILKKCLS